MAYDPKFQPLAGNNYNVKLRFSEPKAIKGEHGTFWVLGVVVNGTNYIWNLNEYSKGMIVASGLKKGETAIINVTQQMSESSNRPYNVFELVRSDGKIFKSNESKSVEQDSSGQDEPPPDQYADGAPLPGEEKPSTDADAPPSADDIIFMTMEKCWLKALDMAENVYVLGLEKEQDKESPVLLPFYAPSSEDVRSIAISMFIQANR